MPQTIGCPNCSSKLKVPDNAGGRRVKCPKCGGVIAIPSGVEPSPVARAPVAVPPATPAEPVSTPPPADPPPARARRAAEDADDRPPPPARAARRRDDDDDRDDRPSRRPARRDEEEDRPTGDDTARLHKGWKSVALGYRMFGLKMLFVLLGVPAGIAAVVIWGEVAEFSDVIRHRRDLDRDIPNTVLIPLVVAGAVAAVVWLFALLGHIFLMGMPKDEKGGKGKGLAGLMLLFLFLPGLGVVNLILLPIFSAGVGTALNKPRLRKYGLGLYVWYAVGFILLPLLVIGTFIGIAAVTDGVTASVIAPAVGGIIGLLVFFSIWGTYAGMRRGIQASIRDRGIIGGEGPQPVKRKKNRRDDDDEEDDRPRRRERNRDREDDRDEPPARRAARAEEDDDRPKKRKREDSDDEIPRAKRRDDDDSDDDDRPRKRR